MKPHAKEEQQKTPFEDMAEYLIILPALGKPFAKRKGHRDPHDKHKEGLDQVPEAQTIPGVMKELLNEL